MKGCSSVVLCAAAGKGWQLSVQLLSAAQPGLPPASIAVCCSWQC
jgi:hypothetical protein